MTKKKSKKTSRRKTVKKGESEPASKTERKREDAKQDQKQERKSPSPGGSSSSDRHLLWAVITILVLFGIILAGYKMAGKGPERDTISELHEKNIKGELGPDEGYMYDGYSFVRRGGMWFTQVQRKGTKELYNVRLHYGPREVENIPVVGSVSDFKNFNGTHVAFDPSGRNHTYTALASAELSVNLAQVFNIMPVAACTRNTTPVCYSRPIVNCSNPKNPVIFMDKSDDNEVVRENEGCIRIAGKGTSLVKATDRLLFDWFGIIK